MRQKLAPIIYGLLTKEAAEASSRGEVFIGDCEIAEDKKIPKYHCHHCILDFDEDLNEPTKSEDSIDFEDTIK